jgi:hypothetical protein
VPITEEHLILMRLLDEQYTATPFYGSRRMQVALQEAGHRVNRKHVQRLMRLMGLEAVGPKPRLSEAHPGDRVYPYLLRNVPIVRVDQRSVVPGERCRRWTPTLVPAAIFPLPLRRELPQNRARTTTLSALSKGEGPRRDRERRAFLRVDAAAAAVGSCRMVVAAALRKNLVGRNRSRALGYGD